MACGSCGSKRAAKPRTYTPSGGNQQFTLVNRDGNTQTFGSRLEADAENARAGFTGIVKPVGGK